jgi:hypothetical protein
MTTADGVLLGLLHYATYRRCLAISPDLALPSHSAFQHPYRVPLQDDVAWEAREWGIGDLSSSSEPMAKWQVHYLWNNGIFVDDVIN